jgi:hypothetical protein
VGVPENGYYERNIHLGKLRKPRNASRLRLLELVYIYFTTLHDVPERHTFHIHHRKKLQISPEDLNFGTGLPLYIRTACRLKLLVKITGIAVVLIC